MGENIRALPCLNVFVSIPLTVLWQEGCEGFGTLDLDRSLPTRELDFMESGG